MTEPREKSPSQLPMIEIPGREISGLIDNFREFRVANRALYLATSDEQFATRISDDIADQRTYLMHQIEHSHARVKAFVGNGAGKLPDDLSLLSRGDLIRLFDVKTQQLIEIFTDPNNLAREVEVPYAGKVKGITVLLRVMMHEALHLGENERTSDHFRIVLPRDVVKAFPDMTAHSGRRVAQMPALKITSEELDPLIASFSDIRAANIAAYLATTDKQFVTDVMSGDDIVSQHDYLRRQIEDAHANVGAFLGSGDGQLPWGFPEFQRQGLIDLLNGKTQQLLEIFRDPNNLARVVEVSNAGRVSGITMLLKMMINEAEYLGINEITLGHLGIARSDEITKPFGR